MENLTITLDIEGCEEVFRAVEDDFDSICSIYSNILTAAMDYAQSWQGENVDRFVEEMESFRIRAENEAVRMDGAIRKMRGCIQKAKEIEALVL